MMPFSVGSHIMGPDMIDNVCFWSVSGVVKVCHFTDGHLVMGDFIHHDKTCMSASILKPAPFKML